MDDGRSPSGGADKQKGGKPGGKGGYVLDSRRSEAETTVGYITNNGIKKNNKRIKTVIRIIKMTNIILLLITVYIGGA
jgi:hypothetical protein